MFGISKVAAFPATHLVFLTFSALCEKSILENTSPYGLHFFSPHKVCTNTCGTGISSLRTVSRTNGNDTPNIHHYVFMWMSIIKCLRLRHVCSYISCSRVRICSKKNDAWVRMTVGDLTQSRQSAGSRGGNAQGRQSGSLSPALQLRCRTNRIS